MDEKNKVMEDLFGIKDCEYLKSSIEKDSKTGESYILRTFRYSGAEKDTCDKCGQTMYKNGTRKITVVHTPEERPVRYSIILPRKYCPACKSTWKPLIPGVDIKHKLTQKALISIAKRSLRDTFESIGEDYMLAPNTIKNIFVEFLELYKMDLRFKTPVFLGIDEIKIKKLGELTVITDLEHRTLFDILQGRNQKTLTEYFMNLPDRDKVLWVCSDMYRPFQKTIGDAMPNARWAIDHFHVVMKANEAVDYVRRIIQASMPKKMRIQTKRGLAYTLKVRANNLSAEEASKLREARHDEALSPLIIAYDLKEDFFNIYDENGTSRDNAEKAFAKWEASIPKAAIYEKFRELARTVHHFYDQIFNVWDCPIAISNGYTECTNRLIRENNIKGRGYSFEVLRGRTLYRKANIDNMIKHHITEIGPLIPEVGAVFHMEGRSEDWDEELGFEEPSDEDVPFYDSSTGHTIDPKTGEILS